MCARPREIRERSEIGFVQNYNKDHVSPLTSLADYLL